MLDLKWVRKAAVVTDDFDPDATAGAGGYLSPQQVKEFLRVAIEEGVMSKEIRQETNISPKFQVPRISLTDRVLVAGTAQAARVAAGSMAKVATGLMELSTVLFKGEVLVSDETFEDQIERAALADTIATMIAQAVGRDIEEIIIKSDTARDPTGADVGDPDAALFDELDGLVKRAQALLTGGLAGQKLDVTGNADIEDIFGDMIEALPPRYRRNYNLLRYYVPTIVRDKYQRALAARGTGVGDQALVKKLDAELAFRGIPVKEVPLLNGTHPINGTDYNYAECAFLVPPSNAVLGFQRKVRMERFRDPRDGATSFLPTVRLDTDWADPNAIVLAENIDSI